MVWADCHRREALGGGGGVVYPPVLSKKITILMQCKASGRWQPPQPTYKASTHLTSRLRKVTALANTHGLNSTHGAIVFSHKTQNRTFMCSDTASRLRQPAQPTHKASTHLTSRLRKVTALANTHGLISTDGAMVFSHPDAKKDLHVQWHGFSTASAVPTHVHSLNTPAFTFAQGYNNPGVYTRQARDSGELPCEKCVP